MWITYGGRRTYAPTFVNERFKVLPNGSATTFYWACTYTAGVMAADIAMLGRGIPSTQAEILALAAVSGDSDLAGGSRTSHLAAAMFSRYGLELRQEDVGTSEAQRRLANGQALIAGVWYQPGTTPNGTKHDGLPEHYARWSPNFTGGHRMLVFGWDNGNTRLIDPLAAKTPDYTGEPIAWSDFARAWWSDDQAWVLEGELMQTVVTVLAKFEPPRLFRVAAGRTVHAYTVQGLAKTLTFPSESGAYFDRYLEITQSPDPKFAPAGKYIRASSGAFEGLYVPIGEVSADVRLPAVTEAELLDARRRGFDEAVAGVRIEAVAPKLVLPTRP